MHGTYRSLGIGFALLLVLVLVLAACGGGAPATQDAEPETANTEAGADTTSAESADAEGNDAEEVADSEEMESEADATDSEGDSMAGDSPAPVAIDEELRQSFGGGPVGGAFQTFANAMALIMQDQYEYLDIAAEGTGGSGENLRSVNAGDLEYGIVYAGDAFLGQSGQLPEDPTQYTSIRPMAPLYGAVAHLVVSVDSGIDSVEDLPGKRIALGNAGSGAALSAERYFTHMGLLDQMQIEFLGYSQAAQAMGDGQLDGFWILTAVPNASVTEASTFTEIKLLDIYNPGVAAGFFDAFPFYTQRAIPGGTYPGNDADIPSFQDTAMFVTHQDVPDDVVYNALVAVFSDEGLEQMRTAHPAAGEMSRDTGVSGIPVTIHPGAHRYWEELGAEVPDTIKP